MTRSVPPQGDSSSGRRSRWRCVAWRWTAAAALGLLLAVNQAFAGSFEVTPIRVEIPPGQRAATVTIQNLGDGPSSIQARAFTWTQVGDQDKLIPTQDVILSPPIFTIPPGQTQTVRLLLRTRDPSPAHPWRLLFDEVPGPSKPGEIVMAMRLSVPILIVPPGVPRLALSWRAERDGPAGFSLLVANHGQLPARLTRVDARLPDGRSLALQPVARNPYVLPGNERRWEPLEGAAIGRLPSGAVLHLTITTQAGPTEQSVALP